ncbi:tRNA pseudouridine synthase A [Oceaniovalibus guishaninsula JLT2003]|uniref:tRNA pseudouridine synthase A n=1 Tax=Oceaniovalibus guishaninsula JLT2003 TaxID=1231392 RepID=K2GL05_9RHOB|nr:tRNA pseudouridine(38-40) synthase TruA [Oceaniovalibus guishaninsula]EKE43451.1 tRNA pseudouridine synthase A [Oceaniovalibus guishaninsula JLT2003]
MPRYALRVEYDGTPFSGWQRQRDRPSVQATVEAALRRLQPDCPGIAAAGRTDAGVHALGQVAQADMARDWDPFRLSEALNHHLRPDPVAITACARVDDGWHARFSAVERRYTYRLLVRRAPPVLARGQVWHIRFPLDAGAMADAARHLVGRHDFTTFRSTMCQANSPLRTLDELRIERTDAEIRVHARARSFLHNQVRSIVGTLERVGAGAWSPADVAAALQARDRTACGPVAPAQGLCLTGVRYPDCPFSTA